MFLWQQAPEAAPELQRLYRDSDMLEDSKTLADLKLDADSVLAMAYRQEGGPRTGCLRRTTSSRKSPALCERELVEEGCRPLAHQPHNTPKSWP
jgi:hypothetical protein